MQKEIEITAIRLDKWLWAARFFKTRGMASEAIKGGKVHVNNMRVKQAKKIKVGDNLEITKVEQLFVINIKGLNDKRRPAKEAVLLYEEDVESKKRRQAKAVYMKEKNINNKLFAQSDKKQKRQVRSFKQDKI